MKRITRQILADRVLGAWKKQYPKGHNSGRDKDAITFKLAMLGNHPNPDKVDKIIGNSSWTFSDCSVCLKEVAEVVQFDNKNTICERCLKKALKLMALALRCDARRSNARRGTVNF